MKKNMKIFFIALTLIFVLGISAVSATDDIQADDALDDSSAAQVEQTKTVSQDNAVKDTTTNEKTISKRYDDITKTEPSSIDYYVSDGNGSDENEGSQTSPFKTIQTAIDKTTPDGSYNIYITEGLYKGAKNTNLTVDGTRSINFIGSGVNKTVIDGDANFTIGTEGSVWGGSGFWNTWYNVSGNWFMNITQGEGLFSITGMTIQNCWSNSGSSIAATPTATIDNHATLNVTDVYFNKNHAGSGAGIRNHNYSTLYVDNCVFENGTKAQTTGNFGAAIYSNGTAVITNTLFIDNYARWGTVTNDYNMTLVNCTFKENHAYDGSSGYKYGSSFYSGTGVADFFRSYPSTDLSSTILDCKFIDNAQCDIADARGDLVVDNCIFNHSVGVYLFPNTNRYNTHIPTQSITNNQFIDMQPSTEFVTTISSTTPSVGIRVLSGYNLTIENNVIDVPDIVYGNGIIVTANTTVKNNTLNNNIQLNGANNTIIENKVNTGREYSISLANAAANAVIANNTLYGGYASGDLSIGNVLSTTTLENNRPVTGTFTVNNENYTTYFDEEGVLRNDVVASGSKLIFVDDLVNKNFIFDNVKVTVDVKTTLINTTIITQNNARVILDNLKIDNTKNDDGYVILLESEGNIIRNANIHLVSDEASQVIKVEEDNNIITGSTINATIPASDVVWNSDWSIGNVPTAGIFIRSSNNIVNNTKLYLTSDKALSTAKNPTVDGIDIQSKKVGEYVTGNEIRNSRINITGGKYVYGLNVARAKDTFTTIVYYDVTSNYYAAAVQIGDSDSNDIAGYIYSNADYQAYGYYSTAMSTGITNNTNASKLYIQGMNAPYAVGVRIEGASNTELSSATYTINGENAKAIEIVKDWMGNVPENTLINALTINLNGQNDTSSIMTVNEAKNTVVNKSTIKSATGQGIILTNTTGSQVTSNYINVANLTGGDYAVTNNTASVVFNNTPIIALLTDETYSQFFNDDNVLSKDVDIITVAGDLHGKVLGFENMTKAITITNAADYTLYNSTIIVQGDSTLNTGTTPLTVEKLNFVNVDQPVFMDMLNGTRQKNVYFENDNITVTGSNIVAFMAYNNQSYVYLDISDSYINLDGDNVIMVYYSGYNRGQPIYITDNVIDVTAKNISTVLFANSSTVQFSSNEVTMNSPTAVMAFLLDSTISYYNFRYNKVDIEAENARVLQMVKGGTSTSYISDNNMTIKSENPVTAINITGDRTVYVQNNRIISDSVNGGEPVVYVSMNSYSSSTLATVQNNYITARDVYGNASVGAGEKVKVQYNNPTSGYGVNITADYDEWVVTKENNLTLTVTNDFGEEITGTLTAKINGEEVPVVDNVITYTPSKAGTTNVVVTFEDPLDVYAKNTTTIKVPVRTLETEIELGLISDNNIVYQPITISIKVTDEDGNPVTGRQVTVTTSEFTDTVELTDEVTQYSFSLVYAGNQTITVSLDTDDVYEESVANITVDVAENYTVNSSTYSKFFDDEGVLKSTVPNGTVLTFSGPIVGKDFIFDNAIVDVISDGTSILYNATIITQNDALMLFNGLKIDNVNKQAIYFESEGNTLINSEITVTSDDKLFPVEIVEDNNILANVTIIANVPSADVEYNPDYSTKVPAPAALLITSSGNYVKDSNILMNSSESVGKFPTTDGIYILSLGETISDNTIENTVVMVIGTNYVYGINVGNAADTVLEDVEVEVYSDYYADAVQLFDADTITISGDLTALADSEAYGVYSTAMGKGISKNINIEDADIYVESLVATGVLIEGSENTTIVDSDFEVVGLNATAIMSYVDWMGNEPKGIEITDCDIKVTTDGDRNVLYFALCSNLEIANNTIKSEGGAPISLIYVDNARVTDNYIMINDVYTGNYGVNSTEFDTVIANNTPVSPIIEDLIDEIEELTGPQNTTVVIDEIETVSYNDAIKITGKVVDQKGNYIPYQTVNVTVNGESVTLDTENGSFTYEGTASSVGINNVTVSYEATEEYRESSAEATFNVTKQKTKLTIDKISSVAYKDNVTISGKLLQANGNPLSSATVKISINGKTTTVTTNSKGVFTYTTQAATVGKNNVTVSYAGNKNYVASNSTSSFTVNKLGSVLTLDKIKSVAYKDEVVISGTLVNARGVAFKNTAISLKINGKTVTVKTDSNGVFKYTTKASAIGKNNVTVTYAGNSKLKAATAKTTFTVTKLGSVLTLNSISNSAYNDEVVISGTLINDHGVAFDNTEVQININGKIVKVMTKNGVFTYTTKAKNIGLNNITVTYAGNSKLKGSSQSTTFSVSKQKTEITLDSIKSVAKGKNVTITGTYKDVNGNAVKNATMKVYINGKKVTAKTDSNGKFKVSRKTDTVGTNNVQVRYDGSSKVEGASAETTFKVTSS